MIYDDSRRTPAIPASVFITAHTVPRRLGMSWFSHSDRQVIIHIGWAVPGAGFSEEMDALFPADACPCEGADLALSGCAEVLLAVPST